MFGIGASTLGFIRRPDAGEPDQDTLIADLQALYGEWDVPAWGKLPAVLRASRVLLLGYTENFATLTEGE